MVPPKRPALGGGFSFRPSLLTKSAEGFLKPSSFKLEPPKPNDTPGMWSTVHVCMLKLCVSQGRSECSHSNGTDHFLQISSV